MQVIKLLAGPLIGAVIGYFTNYIAVKMLFHPRHELRVLGRRVPLTPGAIPRGKRRLAAAIGAVVQNQLLTREALETQLLSPAVEELVADTVVRNLDREIRAMIPLEEAEYREKQELLCTRASQEIVSSIRKSDLLDTILQEMEKQVLSWASGPILRQFINEKTIQPYRDTAWAQLDYLLKSRGETAITPLLVQESDKLLAHSGMELLAHTGTDENRFRESVKEIYRDLIRENAASMFQSLHIAQLVQDKIDSMSVEELEKLVFIMMKKELNTIVSLGALIGFVLGLLNIFL